MALICACGLMPATTVPVPMCAKCAREYYRELLAVATGRPPREAAA
jgi:hypothetical protein